jgi:hypothetical protein
MPCPRGTFPLTRGFFASASGPLHWPQVGGFVVEWLVIAVVAGTGVVALLDPGSIEALFTAEL